MANWKKIILSGSNAHVASITSSVIASVADNSTVLFAGGAGEIEKNSNLTFDSANTSLEFNGGAFSGSFSGSFTGDGSGLTGISFDAEDLTPGSGLAFTNGSTYDGSTAREIEIELATNSGLISDGSGLRINPTLAGDGLDISSGILSINVQVDEGIEVAADSISVDVTDFIGNGLDESSNDIIIDTTQVISSSATITMATGSNNLTLSEGGTNVSTGTGIEVTLADNPNPVFVYDLASTLAGDFTFSDNLTVEGDFTVNGASSAINLQTTNVNIADPFVLVGSGSSNDGGIAVQTSTTTAAFLFYDSDNNAWGVSNANTATGTTDFDLTAVNSDIATIVTCEITSSGTNADLVGANPIFGGATNAGLGSLRVTTAPSAKESSLYIYA